MIWGGLLVLAGLGVFFRTYQQGAVLETIANSSSTALFIRICLYIMSIILIGGGIKKIYPLFTRLSSDAHDPDSGDQTEQDNSVDL